MGFHDRFIPIFSIDFPASVGASVIAWSAVIALGVLSVIACEGRRKVFAKR